MTTFKIDELMGTKLRALYQRTKGRDLFDLWLALTARLGQHGTLLDCFQRHMSHGGHTVRSSRGICLRKPTVASSARTFFRC